MIKKANDNGLMDALQLINAKGDPQELQKIADKGSKKQRSTKGRSK